MWARGSRVSHRAPQNKGSTEDDDDGRRRAENDGLELWQVSAVPDTLSNGAEKGKGRK